MKNTIFAGGSNFFLTFFFVCFREFKQEIPQMAIITLKDLIPGNYTVKVTVTDKDQASDSALATIMVIPEPDYPPTANAGEDLIIYLPKNKVI